MQLILKRFADNGQATIGGLYFGTKLLCFTLEDEARLTKVKGETRIPAGEYEIKYRTVGGHHEKYSKLYKNHKGMLELQNVPNFQFILIHIGNYEKDTDGCLLVGMSANANPFTIQSSTQAYLMVYDLVSEALNKGEKVTIKILEYDK